MGKGAGTTTVGRLTEQLNPVLQTQVDDKIFRFNVGQPNPYLQQKAFDMIREASLCAFADANLTPWVMQYGAECGPPGVRLNLLPHASLVPNLCLPHSGSLSSLNSPGERSPRSTRG